MTTATAGVVGRPRNQMSLSRPALYAVLTVLALSAFAANSLLCRMALRDGAIDPVSFTQIRLCSGALANTCRLADLTRLVATI